ncbi:MAG: glycosyltransferase family 2 protein [Nitrosotalea sp.]
MKEADSTTLDNVFVSIIILNYNGGNYTLECLDSIFKATSCKKEILLIDNGSSDKSHIICKEKFPEIILIQNTENIGMAARTIGLEKAQGDFIVFLDSDTVVANDWLLYLVNSYRKNGEGLYQPKLLEKKRPNIINSCGNMINIFALAYSRGKGEHDMGKYDVFSPISYTSGACSFASSVVMKKIGYVDSLFFAYHDDVDFGWRALLLGIQSYYEPKSVVYHYGSQTLEWSKKKFFLLERNRWICLLTLYSKTTLVKIFPLLILVEIGMCIFFLRKGMGLEKLRSYFSLIRMRKDIKERKERIMKNRKFDDKMIIKNFGDDFWLPVYALNDFQANLVNSFIRLLSKQARKIIR